MRETVTIRGPVQVRVKKHCRTCRQAKSPALLQGAVDGADAVSNVGGWKHQRNPPGYFPYGGLR